jgi:hypothetical protein
MHQKAGEQATLSHAFVAFATRRASSAAKPLWRTHFATKKEELLFNWPLTPQVIDLFLAEVSQPCGGCRSSKEMLSEGGDRFGRPDSTC